jgi:ABC-type transporter Mla MlaB component
VLRPVAVAGTQVPGWRVVSDLDVATEERARAELAAAVARCCAEGHGWCVLQFDDVFVDVRGTAVLLEAQELARASGCRLVVVGAPMSLRTIWEALHLDGVVPLLRSQVEARMLIDSGRHDG